MKYVVQTVASMPERLAYAMGLRERLGAFLYTDMAREPHKAFSGSLLATGGGAHVHLEDDVILAKDFESLIEDAARQYPDDVINFFLPNPHRLQRSPSRLKGFRFSHTQCVYIPDWFPLAFVDWSVSVDTPPRPERRWDGLDDAVAHFLHHVDRGFVQWFPCLAQHMDLVSTIDPDRRALQSHHFIDDIT